jgi:ABC-type bacteriocin/lantibiotic exporter with double-glycine peptidase domain
MKRVLARVLPHLTIILGVMTLVFYVVDGFNAVMAFMASELSKQVFLVLAVCAIISSIMLIARQWKEDDRKARKAARQVGEAEAAATEALFELEEVKKSREQNVEEE